MSLTVKMWPQGPLAENTYLIIDDATGLKAVVDPGYYGPDTEAAIENDDSLKYILLTHGHHDHYAAIKQYKSRYPEASFLAPEGDKYLLYESRTNKWIASGTSKDYLCPQADVFVNDGDVVQLGETEIKVVATPGHSEGGISFVTDGVAFTGDTLFRLSVGNTSFETGDWATMVKSIKEKLYTLDDDTIVYPGHGPATTIGYEKKANPFV